MIARATWRLRAGIRRSSERISVSWTVRAASTGTGAGSGSSAPSSGRPGPRPVASHSKWTCVTIAMHERCCTLGNVPPSRSHCATALRRTPVSNANCVWDRPAVNRARRILSHMACIYCPLSLLGKHGFPESNSFLRCTEWLSLAAAAGGLAGRRPAGKRCFPRVSRRLDLTDFQLPRINHPEPEINAFPSGKRHRQRTIRTATA